MKLLPKRTSFGALMSSCLVSEHSKSCDFIDDVSCPGHVIYEMSTGKMLGSSLIPEEEDYEHVTDEECKEILKYIFTINKNGGLKWDIEEVCCLKEGGGHLVIFLSVCLVRLKRKSFSLSPFL